MTAARWIVMAGVLYVVPVATVAQNCCDRPACAAEAQSFADNIASLVQQLDEPPAGREETEKALAHLKVTNRELYKNFMRAVGDYIEWTSDESGPKSLCFSEKVPIDDTNTIPWIQQVTTYKQGVNFSSAEFCRGFDVQAEIGLGSTGLGSASEGFGATVRVLASYTFAPTDPAVHPDNVAPAAHCGGRVRLMAGVSQSYLGRRGITFATLRMELRLVDLADDLASLGHVKLMVQGNTGINRSVNSVGIGVGLDLQILGLHLMHSWQDEIVDNVTELGLYYKF